jgi:alpha-tubulin suppressor-like RCC1 family protein
LVAGLEEQKSHFHPMVSRAFSGKSWVQICGGQHHSIALDSEGELLLSSILLVSL